MKDNNKICKMIINMNLMSMKNYKMILNSDFKI